MTKPINALLLPGWTVTNVVDHGDKIEYLATPPQAKPSCQTLTCPAYQTSAAMKRRDARPRKITDLPVLGKPSSLIVRVARYRCNACGKQATQPLPDIHEKHSMTIRCVEYIERESLRRPFTWVARDLGVDDGRVRYISRGNVERSKVLAPQSKAAVRVMGIDDIYLQRTSRTIVVDLETRKPIELLKSQTKEAVKTYLDQIEGNEAIEIVCMDMASHFAKSVKQSLPKASIVFDKWHVIRQSLDGMNEARKQCQRYIRAQAGTDKRKKSSADIEIKLMKKHYTLFLRRRFYKFGPGLREKLENYFDLWPSLRAAYELKEQFCDIWAANSKEDAKARMINWIAAHDEEIKRYELDLRAAKIAHITEGKRTDFIHVERDPARIFAGARGAIERNRKFILSYFDQANVGANGRRFTNAPTEAINGLIKEINRRGRGYDFENLRARVLLKEPYSPLVRKTQSKKRAKQSKKVINAFKTATGPIPKEQVFRVEGGRKTRCASAGCHKEVILPKRMKLNGSDSYDVPHIFRFCERCYEARLPYVDQDHDETDRYVLQQELPFLEPAQ